MGIAGGGEKTMTSINAKVYKAAMQKLLRKKYDRKTARDLIRAHFSEFKEAWLRARESKVIH